ncbi:MAG: hypothetical protein KKB51_10925 [Candidatus Riflebacteria bacterium]|nr:hypothetical protein [Candidatus Riflebacteria bacterium]
MKKRYGLTLIETCLSVTLASIFLTTLFSLADNHRKILRRIQNNTTALYMLESMRNFTRFQLESGVGLEAIGKKDLEELIESEHKWSVSVSVAEDSSSKKIRISLANTDAGKPDCIYTTEVFAR